MGGKKIVVFSSYINLKKRLMCIFFCILVVFSSIFIKVEEAQAFVPLVIAGVTIAPEIVAAGATLLCAAGVSFASSPDAQRAFTEMYVSASTGLKDAFNSLGSGVRSVGDSLWDYTRSWVNSKFATPNTTVVLDSSYHETISGEIGSSGAIFPYSLDKNVAFGIGDTWVLTQACTISGVNYSAGSTMWLERVLYAGSAYTHRFVINGVVAGYASSSSGYCDVTAGYTFYIYRANGKYNLAYKTIYQGQPRYYDFISQSVISANTMSQVHYDSITAQTADIVGNATYDFKTDGRRDILVLENVDGVVNKTYLTVQNPVVVQPTTVPMQTGYVGTWTGYFKDCTNGMGAYVFDGSGTVVGDMDYSKSGTWIGTWGWSDTGARVWTGTYTAADATAWTGTATESLTGNVSSTWDYSSWVTPVDILKTKFPFSIPWDFKNAITSLMATPQVPKWTIEFPPNYFVGGCSVDIDFSQFEVWAKIVRWGILIIFNIFLILTTRRMIGAGG